MTRRTGAGALVNPDNLIAYWVAVALLTAGALAPLVASVDGLLHVAAWYMPEALQWTLPFAFDVLMIGSAITALALRRRHARIEATAATVLTLTLVLASGWANWLQKYVELDQSTVEGQASPWIKAAMPLLTFIGFEIIAMLTSTRKQGENAPLRRAKADVVRLKAQLRAAKKASGGRVDAGGRGVQGAIPGGAPRQLHGDALDVGAVRPGTTAEVL